MVFSLSHRRPRRGPLDREAAKVDRVAGRRVHVDDLYRLIRDDADLDALNRISSSSVPPMFLDMRRHVDRRELSDDSQLNRPGTATRSTTAVL